MAEVIIKPGQSANFDADKPIDSLALKNKDQAISATYKIQFDDDPVEEDSLNPGQTRTYDLPIGQSVEIRVDNTGKVNITAILS